MERPILWFEVLVLLLSPLGSALAAELSGEIEVPGGRLHYQEMGNGAPLVLLHDGLLPSITWADQLDALAQHFRVISYDRRGYGGSTPATEPFSAVDDLSTVLDQLGVVSVSIMGCSSGGGLAVDFAVANPQRVDALVLIGPVVSGMSYSAHFMERVLTVLGPLFSDGDLAATIDLLARDQYHTASQNQEARQRFRELLEAHFNAQIFAVQPTPPATPALDRLREIAAPTLLIVGEADSPDVHAHVGALEAGIRGAERVVFPDAGHFVHLEHPRLCNRLVLEFLCPEAMAAAYLATVGQGPSLRHLQGRFSYDPTAPLDLREEVVEQRGPVRIIDLSYASPVAGRVTAYLVVPESGQPVPGVLFQHPGEGNRSSFLDEATLLAQIGIGSLLIDGPSQRPEEHQPPRKENPAERRVAELTQLIIDQRRGLDLLAGRPEIDPERLAYVGHSLGATVGGILLALEPRLNTSVMMAGFAAHTRSLSHGHKYSTVYFSSLYNAEEQAALLQAMAPLDAVHFLPHRPPRPMLLQFALRDEYISRWDAAVYRQAAGQPVQVEWFDTDHGFDLQARRSRIAWLANTLLNDATHHHGRDDHPSR